MQCQLYLHIRILHTLMYQIGLCHTKSYYHAPSIFASRAYIGFITFYRFMCKSLLKCRLQISGPYSIAFITFNRFMCKSLQKCGLQINGKFSLSVKLFLKKDYKYSAEKYSLRSDFTLLTLSK